MPGSVIYVRDDTNNKNVQLKSDSSQNLKVVDSVNALTLSSMDSTLNGQSLSLGSIDAQLSSQATASNQATANTSLGSIDTKLSSQATASNQTTTHTKLDTINTTLQGTLTVSASNPARASGNIASSSSKTAGDVSSSVDGNLYRKAVIFGSSSSNSASVRIQISHDDVNYFEHQNKEFFANASNGHFAGEFDLNARYFKIEFMNTATYTCEYALVD